MTTKITVPEHILEYIQGKYRDFVRGIVRFPDHLEIYHVIYDLLEVRSASAPQVDKGNLEIHLPSRSVGKCPEVYNYLGIRSQDIIRKRLETMLWAEVHEYLDDQKHRYGIEYINGVHAFIRKYAITSISEDAFIKNYYRWRAKVRRKEKRNYRKKSEGIKCS